MTRKFVVVADALRGTPLPEPPDRTSAWDIVDVVSGDEHQGKICGNVSCLYKGTGELVLVKVNLNFDFLLLIRNYVTRE